MSLVFEIQTPDQLHRLLSTYKIVVIDTYADWCSPCKMMEPKYEQMAADYSSKFIIFTKCNVNTNLTSPKSLPTLDVYINGTIFKTLMGADLKGLNEIFVNLGVEKRNFNPQSVGQGQGQVQGPNYHQQEFHQYQQQQKFDYYQGGNEQGHNQQGQGQFQGQYSQGQPNQQQYSQGQNPQGPNSYAQQLENPQSFKPKTKESKYKSFKTY